MENGSQMATKRHFLNTVVYQKLTIRDKIRVSGEKHVASVHLINFSSVNLEINIIWEMGGVLKLLKILYLDNKGLLGDKVSFRVHFAMQNLLIACT